MSFLIVAQLHLNFVAVLSFHCRGFLVWFVFMYYICYMLCIIYDIVLFSILYIFI